MLSYTLISNRILDFRHTLPVIGRVLNITSDIKPYADGEFGATFFVSPAGNLCFFGTCKVYCDVFHPICGKPDLIEGSLAAYIPEFDGSERKVRKEIIYFGKRSGQVSL